MTRAKNAYHAGPATCAIFREGQDRDGGVEAFDLQDVELRDLVVSWTSWTGCCFPSQKMLEAPTNSRKSLETITTFTTQQCTEGEIHHNARTFQKLPGRNV